MTMPGTAAWHKSVAPPAVTARRSVFGSQRAASETNGLNFDKTAHPCKPIRFRHAKRGIHVTGLCQSPAATAELASEFHACRPLSHNHPRHWLTNPVCQGGVCQGKLRISPCGSASQSLRLSLLLGAGGLFRTGMARGKFHRGPCHWKLSLTDIQCC